MKRQAFWLVCGFIVIGRLTSAQISSPAEATVFVRVVGAIEVEPPGFFSYRIGDNDTEVGVGSGFLISPNGYILTSYHLIEGQDVTLDVDGELLEASIDVQRIEVALPPEIDSDSSEPARFYRASVQATDPDRDLALLLLQGAELPYIPLGDSGAIHYGDPVQVFGFPLGWETDVGRQTVDMVVPEVSITRGALSAVRRDEGGQPLYLQTDAAVNPGNSGGPVVSTDGFALGVMNARLRGGRGIGFAVPINLVKDFLLENGFDWMFPVQRLELGPQEAFPGKGLQMRLPEGFSDLSDEPHRVECDNGFSDLFLRVDRFFSLWSLEEVEQSLLSRQEFEEFHHMTTFHRRFGRKENAAVLRGHAIGFDAYHDEELKMEYLIVDMGTEVLVARYIGPSEVMAFNLSVLRASLTSLDFDLLLSEDVLSSHEAEEANERSHRGRR